MMIFLRHSYCRDVTLVASPCIILNASQCLMIYLFLLFYETPLTPVTSLRWGRFVKFFARHKKSEAEIRPHLVIITLAISLSQSSEFRVRVRVSVQSQSS